MSVQTELILTLLVTVIVTTAIFRGLSWLQKNKERYPKVYNRRGILGNFIYAVLMLYDMIR